MFKAQILFLVFGLCLSSGVFNSHDLNKLSRLSGLSMKSPENDIWSIDKRDWDEDSNTLGNHVCMGDFDGGFLCVDDDIQDSSDFNSFFFADGSLGFLSSDEDGLTQLFRYGPDQKREKLTDFPISIANPMPSSDGKFLSFTAYVFTNSTMQETADREKQKEQDRVKANVWTKLYVRHWATQNTENLHSHVFVQELEAGYKPIGQPQDLMNNFDQNTPTEPWGGSEQISWSPDNCIVFTVETDKAWDTNDNLYMSCVDSNLHFLAPTCITCLDNQGRDTAPAFSHDGTKIAYLTIRVASSESDPIYVALYDLVTSTITVLTEQWDRSVSSIGWSLDDSLIYLTAGNEGHNLLYKIPPSVVTTATPITKVDSVHSFVALGNQILVTKSSFQRPDDVFSLSFDGKQITKLTTVNDDLLAQFNLVDPVIDYFTGEKGEPIQTLFFPPSNYVEGKKYPLLLWIHGGPEGAWDSSYSFRWSYQAWLDDLAMVCVNPEGSTGFGFNLTHGIRRNWGGSPINDILHSVDFVLDKYDWLDADRVGAMGASYGGYATNWIATHNTSRFKVFVTHDGMWDLSFMAWETDEMFFLIEEFGTLPDKDQAIYDKFNPSRFADGLKVPHLIVHGAEDYRIPEYQGISIFQALQYFNVPSELILFPRACHWILNPNDSIFWHEEIGRWLRRWLHF